MTYILRHGSYLHRSDQHIVEGLRNVSRLLESLVKDRVGLVF